jgi:hypothetical protein
MPDLSSFLNELSTVFISKIVLTGSERSTPAGRVFVGCGTWPSADLRRAVLLRPLFGRILALVPRRRHQLPPLPGVLSMRVTVAE